MPYAAFFNSNNERRPIMINERVHHLRALMAENHIDAYIIPTADFHESEYVGDYFKARKYMSGFTGSAGTWVKKEFHPLRSF